MKKGFKRALSMVLSLAMIVTPINLTPTTVKAATMEEMVADEGYNLALGKTTVAYPGVAEGNKSYLNDGKLTAGGDHCALSSGWGYLGECYAVIDLGKIYKASGIDQILLQYKDAADNDTVISRGYKIQYSYDGVTYTDVKSVEKVDTFENNGVTNSTIDNVTGTSGNVRYVKVYYPKSATYGIQLTEIAILDTDKNIEEADVTPANNPASVTVSSTVNGQIDFTIKAGANQDNYTYAAFLDEEKVAAQTGCEAGKQYSITDVASGNHTVKIISNAPDMGPSSGLVSESVRVYTITDVVTDNKKNLALGKAYTLDRETSAEGSGSITDGLIGNSITYYATATKGQAGSFATINLENTYDASDISSVYVWFRSATGGTYPENGGFEIQYSTDGNNFTTVATISQTELNTQKKAQGNIAPFYIGADVSSQTVISSVKYVRIFYPNAIAYGAQMSEVGVFTNEADIKPETTAPVPTTTEKTTEATIDGKNLITDNTVWNLNDEFKGWSDEVCGTGTSFNIDTNTSANWYSLMAHTSISFQKGKKYNISFTVKSSYIKQFVIFAKGGSNNLGDTFLTTSNNAKWESDGNGGYICNYSSSFTWTLDSTDVNFQIAEGLMTSANAANSGLTVYDTIKSGDAVKMSFSNVTLGVGTEAPTEVPTEAPTKETTTTLAQTDLATPIGFVTQLSNFNGEDVVYLAWQPVVEATGYRLYIDGIYSRDINTGVNIPVGELPSGKHDFQITAYNAAGESAKTAAVSLTIPESSSVEYTYTQSTKNSLFANTNENGNNYIYYRGVSAKASSGNAANAIDKNIGSRWESNYSDPQYIIVDLGAVYSFKEVSMIWETAQAKNFTIEISNDNITYKKIAEKNDVAQIANRYDRFSFTSDLSARYIKISGTARNSNYGYSIYEIAVYGKDSISTDIPEEPTTEEPTTKPLEFNNVSSLKVENYGKYTGKYFVNFKESDLTTDYKLFVDNTLVKSVKSSGTYFTRDELSTYENGNHTLKVISVKQDTLEESSGVTTDFTLYDKGGNDDIPQIYIYSNGQGISTDYFTAADVDVAIVDNSGKYSDIVDSLCNAKIRGNSTANGDKKPYNIKLSSKKSVLGMDKSKKWSLLANAFDKSLMRNALTMQLAQAMDLAYTSDNRYVDVYSNGKYLGNYLLIESVEVGTGRVEIEADDTTTDDMLLELDNRGDGDVDHLNRTGLGVSFEINEPEVDDYAETSYVEKKERVSSILNNFEAELIKDDFQGMSQYADMESLAKFYIVNEYMRNQDFNFSSTRFYTKDGKIYGGPCWDYDLSSGNIGNYYGENINGVTYNSFKAQQMVWYQRLMKNTEFFNLVRQIYKQYMPQIKALYDGSKEEYGYGIDGLYSQFGQSFLRNYLPETQLGAGWSVINPDGADAYSYATNRAWNTYEDSISFLKIWLQNRNEWLCDKAQWNITDAEETTTEEATTEEVTSAESEQPTYEVETSVNKEGNETLKGALTSETYNIDGTTYNNYSKYKGVTAYASSATQSEAYAMDGILGTRWESEREDNQTLTVDFGNVYKLKDILIYWETASAKDYDIEISTDGTTFEKVVNFNSTTQGRIDDIKFASERDVRAVKLKFNTRNTIFAFSIYEMGIYGSSPQGEVVSVLSKVKVSDYSAYTDKYLVFFNEASDSNGYNIYIDDDATPIKSVKKSGNYLNGSDLSKYGAGSHMLYVTNVSATGKESAKIGTKFTITDKVGTNTNIPQVYINSTSAISQEYLATANISVAIIDKDGGTSPDLFDGSCNMKIRGNTTAGAPKKPWNIKLSSKQSVLGMEKGKKWCLLANSFDKSLIRNKLAYDLGLEAGVTYSSNSRLVEVYFNGQYQGNYLITEPVDVGSGLVDIDAYNADNNDILLELGTRNEVGVDHFTTDALRTTYDVNAPEKGDDLTDAQVDTKIARVKEYLNGFENALKTHDYENILQYMDEDTFINFYITNELFKNVDFNFSSTRFYIKDNKVYAGPLWDFDLSSGNCKSAFYTDYYTYGDSAKGFYCQSQNWYRQLVQTPEFMEKLKARYKALQGQIQGLYKTDSTATNSINNLVNTYGDSFARNYASKDQLGAGWELTNDDGYSFAAESGWTTWNQPIEFLRNWLERRNTWICEQWNIDPTEEQPTTEEPTTVTQPDEVTGVKVSSEGTKINVSFDGNENGQTYNVLIGDTVVATNLTAGTYSYDGYEKGKYKVTVSASLNGVTTTGVSLYANVNPDLIVGFDYSSDAADNGDVLYATEDGGYEYYATNGSGKFTTSVTGTALKHAEWLPDTFIDDFGSSVSPAAVIKGTKSNLWSANAYGKYTFSTVGKTGMEMSIDLGATVDGPGNYTISYIADNDETGIIGTVSATTANLISTYTFDLPAALENQNNATVMISLTDSMSIGGTDIVGTKGSYWAMNNFEVKSKGQVAPEVLRPVGVATSVSDFEGYITIGSDEDRTGYTYNVFVDGNQVLTDVVAGTYKLEGLEVGSHAIEVYSHYNNELSKPVSVNIDIPSRTFKNKVVSFDYVGASTDIGKDMTKYAYPGNDYTYYATSGNGKMTASLTGSNLKHMEWGDSGDYGVVTPIMPASSDNPWSKDAYVSYTFSTLGYTGLQGSFVIGGTKKGPANIVVGYYDGDEFVTLTTYKIAKNKKLYEVNFDIPEALENKADAEIFIKIADTMSIGGTDIAGGTGGEMAINNFDVIYESEEEKSVQENVNGIEINNTFRNISFNWEKPDTTDSVNVYLYDSNSKLLEKKECVDNYSYSGLTQETAYKAKITTVKDGLETEGISFDFKTGHYTGITGYQITTTLGNVDGRVGVRVVYDREQIEELSNAKEFGLIYGLDDENGNISDEDLVVNSTNSFITHQEATDAGKLDVQMGDSSTADYYVMTMEIANKDTQNKVAAFNQKYRVRSYAILQDGTVTYSGVNSYRAIDIAKKAYEEGKIQTYNKYDSLYNDVINIVEPSYEKIDYNWNCTLAKDNLSEPTEKDLKIEGYQMTSTLGNKENTMGLRVVYSIDNETKTQATEVGLVYGLEYNENTISDEEMVIDSSNDFIKSYAATDAGKLAVQMGNSSTANYYARTMDVSGQTILAYNTTYKVRMYARLSTGEITYGDVKSYTVYNVADALYKNNLMSTFNGHMALYDNIITKVNELYKEVDYDWNNSVVK